MSDNTGEYSHSEWGIFFDWLVLSELHTWGISSD